MGNVSISFIEPTLGGGKERRCIYDEDRDVDMIISTPLQFENALKEGVAEWVMNRGWILLYDGSGHAEMIPQFVKLEVHHAVMTKLVQSRRNRKYMRSYSDITPNCVSVGK